MPRRKKRIEALLHAGKAYRQSGSPKRQPPSTETSGTANDRGNTAEHTSAGYAHPAPLAEPAPEDSAMDIVPLSEPAPEDSTMDIVSASPVKHDNATADTGKLIGGYHLRMRVGKRIQQSDDSEDLPFDESETTVTIKSEDSEDVDWRVSDHFMHFQSKKPRASGAPLARYPTLAHKWADMDARNLRRREGRRARHGEPTRNLLDTTLSLSDDTIRSWLSDASSTLKPLRQGVGKANMFNCPQAAHTNFNLTSAFVVCAFNHADLAEYLQLQHEIRLCNLLRQLVSPADTPAAKLLQSHFPPERIQSELLLHLQDVSPPDAEHRGPDGDMLLTVPLHIDVEAEFACAFGAMGPFAHAGPAAYAGMNWDEIRLLVSRANGTARYPMRRGTVERGAPIKDCGKVAAVSS